MLAFTLRLAAFAACLLLAAAAVPRTDALPSSNHQQLPFVLDDGPRHTDEAARFARLLSDDDLAVPYPIDAQRLVRLTPRPMHGYLARLQRTHDRQLESQRARDHRLAEQASAMSWLDRLYDAALGLDGGDGKLPEHNIYEPAYLTQPLDHFDNSTSATFEQKFYYSLRHYRPASHRNEGEPVPVFILDSGEAALEARLPFLESGIVDILANATGGIGVILEHRYYGTSYPNRTLLGSGDTWGTDQFRWLTYKQALEDSARFIRNLHIDGIDNDEPRKVIYYGGSYPGSRAAHMRVLYPDLVHGSIASSAVVAAVDEFPEYFYPIARGAEAGCSQAIQAAIAGIDAILAPDPYTGHKQPKRNETEAKALLGLFGLEELSEPADLANLLTSPLGAFQSQNWDPNVTSTEFGDLCHTLTHYGKGGFAPSSQSSRSIASGLSVSREVHAYAKFIRSNYVLPCLNGDDDDGDDDGGGGNPSFTGAATNASRADECFGSSDVSSFVNARRLSAGKAWTYQYCTTWGYIMTAPPVAPARNGGEGKPVLSGPKLVSTLLDYEWAHDICKRGFPDGEFNKVPDRPRVEEVNDLGGFAIEMDRLAFIDGQFDPWRPASVHSEEFAYGGARTDTLQRPFVLIPNCWHHCDENGVHASIAGAAEVPRRVRKVHQYQIEFVKDWLRQP